MSDPSIPAAESIDPAAYYRVEIKAPVKVSGIRLRPRCGIVLRGDVLKTLIEESADVIVSAVAQ